MVALVQSVPVERQQTDDRGMGRMRFEQPENDRLVLERRIFGRRRVNVHADARRFDHTVAARRDPRVRLQILDVSIGGLSAVTLTPLEAGEHVGVSFPPDLGQRGWNAFGRVIRCEPAADGYQVAVAFDSLPAA